MTEEKIDIIIRTLVSCFPDLNYTTTFDLSPEILAVGVCTIYKGAVYMATDKTARMMIRSADRDKTQAYIKHLRTVVPALYRELSEQIEQESRKYDE
jgi:hypothetical protein